ncbi:hypothetical protein FB45DRAFT_916189, partial [Roridomyces roridus]
MFASTILFAFLSLGLFASAVDVTGQVQWNQVCSNVASLGPAKVVLDGGRFKGNVIFDGSFSIPDVPEGTYILSVLAHNHTFDELRIDVLESGFEARPYSVGTALNPPSSILLPQISLLARTKHVYFVPIDSFNIAGMFQNPMMLLMLFGGAMVFAMPYLMKNMDPETMKEFQEQQAKLSGAQSAFASGNIGGGLSALIADDAPPSKAAPASASSSKNRNSNVKSKRR